MSYIKKAIRVQNDPNTLKINPGETTWGSIFCKEYTLQTTDATLTVMATIPLDDNIATRVDVIVVGRKTTNANAIVINLSMTWVRFDNGAPVPLGVVTSGSRSTAGASNWTAQLITNGNTEVRLHISGQISSVIDWVAVVQTMKG